MATKKSAAKATKKNVVNIMEGRPTKDALGNPTIDRSTFDAFNNFVANLGIQSNNLSAQSYYSPGPFISRNRLELEAAYRDSWLVGQVIDCIAEDMTRDGVEFFSELEPEDIQKLQAAISEFGIWHDLGQVLKWARLYGGAIAVILIDGADYSKPLNIEHVGKDKFKGLAVLDRWQLQPSMDKLITDIGKDMGKPEYYDVLPGMITFPSHKIHYTRIIRFEGIELPYYQRLFENLWGLSVVERMLDRLLAFDSATQGAAQLLYKAYLRVIGVKGFREALAQGGKEENAVIKQFQYIRLMQSNEGITVLDGEDTFNTHTYSFSGISDLLQEFGQQISGATNIPLVRLFGQSPRGFSTGDTDLRNYYDHIKKCQENQMRHQLDKLFAVMSMSKLGKPLPEDFQFQFISLWQMDETQKSAIAAQDSSTINGVYDNGLISKHTALKELRQLSRATGRFTNITDEEIEEAKDEIPPSMTEALGVSSSESSPPGDPNDKLGAQSPDLIDEEPEKEAPEDYRGTAKDSLWKRFTDAFFGRKLTSEQRAEISSIINTSHKSSTATQTNSPSTNPGSQKESINVTKDEAVEAMTPSQKVLAMIIELNKSIQVFKEKLTKVQIRSAEPPSGYKVPENVLPEHTGGQV